MITDEHFETLRKVRAEAEQLRLVCVEADVAASLLHMAYDREISLKPSESESALLGKLRIVQ